MTSNTLLLLPLHSAGAVPLGIVNEPLDVSALLEVLLAPLLCEDLGELRAGR